MAIWLQEYLQICTTTYKKGMIKTIFCLVSHDCFTNSKTFFFPPTVNRLYFILDCFLLLCYHMRYLKYLDFINLVSMQLFPHTLHIIRLSNFCSTEVFLPSLMNEKSIRQNTKHYFLCIMLFFFHSSILLNHCFT